MELLIRSQNRESLISFENLFYFNTCNEMASVGENYILNKMWIGDKDCVVLGKYKTKERALEILDEIQHKSQNIFLCKPNILLKPEYILSIEKQLNEAHPYEFIMQPELCDIQPINCDVVIYEMPKE